MPHLRVVTDCTPEMLTVVGASVSKTNAPPNELWMGCIAHQLNTAPKHTCRNLSLSNAAPDLADIHTNLSTIRAIVTFMKHSERNYLPSEGYTLLQELKTWFGMTLNVVERFIKSANLIELHLSPAMKSLFSGLRVQVRLTGRAITAPLLWSSWSISGHSNQCRHPLNQVEMSASTLCYLCTSHDARCFPTCAWAFQPAPSRPGTSL